jgi:oligopeptide transport system substrate-binding protein
LEIFTRGNPENYPRIDDPIYEKLVHDVGHSANESARKIACRKAIERLIDTHRIIPLGEMFFSVLAKANFQGWDLNELNQLDLTDLVQSP